MQDFKNKRILLGICGGIAAYKITQLVRELTQLGAEVQVVMTASAEAFVTPMTLQALSGRAVRTALFDETAEQAMGHIELARWADYCVIAPATANTIAKLAHGIADDLLSTLALVLKIPLMICPAMNQSMWHHPATQANIKLLSDRGAFIIGPGEGVQACGDEGLGRMFEVQSIINALRLQNIHNLLAGQRVVITAGPTREAIDPVRYLSNHSSGKMGYALAEAARFAGAEVILISGPSALTPPEGIVIKRVKTAVEMHQAVMGALEPGCIFIGAAAVSDYAIDTPSETKIKKQANHKLAFELKQNPDILADVAASKKARFVMGFAAETDHLISYARKKLINKNLDCIVANQVGEGLGFDVEQHEVTVLTRTKQHNLSKKHKVRLAGELVAIIAASLQNSGTLIPELADELSYSS
ncbi:MAG: bifunctional phosphopantothenoylcysteine decarboxylase/phosphopantothenate--cysteine ligase CoaBC [Legionella sp.]|jgi:phosphopantothenoylcysteine decarboxylase/phosphopantothenate--cysteine ligase|nr:bifunctional phosphopantothenoylcysteine decarboxylase/phosphopantothenate--cysteine ligase CoaBC [Legionella sp.]